MPGGGRAHPDRTWQGPRSIRFDNFIPFGYPVTLLLGAPVAAELVDAFGNPTLVPLEPLKPATKYHARMQWSGGPDVTWSFTTGT